MVGVTGTPRRSTVSSHTLETRSDLDSKKTFLSLRVLSSHSTRSMYRPITISGSVSGPED